MKPFFSLLVFGVFYLQGYGQQIVHPGGMHTLTQLKFTKSRIRGQVQPYGDAYRQLMTDVDSAIGHPVHALADFSVPGFYIDAEGHRKNSKSLQSDAFDAYACALAYSLGGSKKSAAEAIRFLNAWAATNTTYSEADGALVMAYSGTALVMAGELLYHSKEWKNADRERFKTWVRNVYKKACDEIRHRKNNWADWGRFGSILSAYFLDDAAEIRENIRLIKSDLADKIAEDGHMPHETRRGANGIWYTYFSLAPITAACWVAYNATGENIFTGADEGRFLKRAVDYLYHYNLHPGAWPWFENPRPGSPEYWPGNLLEALSGIYGDPRYEAYSAPARPIRNRFHHFAWTFPTLMKPELPLPEAP